MSKKLTKHHLIPKERGGDNNPINLVRLPEDMHRAYHTLFDTMTLEESIIFLGNIRDAEIDIVIVSSLLQKSKNINKDTPLYEILPSFAYKAKSMRNSYRILFAGRTLDEAIDFLETWREGNHKVIKPIA